MALCFGLIIGIGITAACMGLFSAIMILLFIYIGVIRITPLCNYTNTIIQYYFPSIVSTIKTNINKSFQMSGNTKIKEGRYIFMWHPHGVFSTSLFFHTCTSITNAPTPIRNAKAVAFNGLRWFPFVNEIFSELLDMVYSDYDSMKQTLVNDLSISLCPGGMREMLYEDSAILLRRRGIFKMALETGTPLVPILSIGETSLSKIYTLPQWIQDSLKSYDACISIPTYNTIIKYMNMLYTPLKDPINSIIGEPILVEKVDTPTEKQISDLRTTYIESLKLMYKKEMGRELTIL